MITQYIKGDIVEIFRLGNDIAHGCNCFCTMGAGVAAQLAENFKQIYAIDKDTKCGDLEKLGDCTFATHDNDHNVCFNLYTQFNPGANVDYGAIFNAFHSLRHIRHGLARPLYIPRIGAGIAGGDWKIIEKLINLATPHVSIIVVDYCPNAIELDTGEVVSLDFLENADTIKRDPKRLP